MSHIIRPKINNGISAFSLKMIAAAAMLCDHIAVVFLNSNYIMRSIGRLAFPIFAFFIVEGYFHTSNFKKYAIRLFIFSIIAQGPYILALEDKLFAPNVIFTLFLGLISIYVLDISKDVFSLIIPVLIAMIAEIIGSDHGAFGIMMIVVFYWFKSMNKKLVAAAILILAVQIAYIVQSSSIDIYTLQFLYYLIPLILIYFYQGKKGLSNKFSKWFFYIFYPLHLLLIWFASYLSS